MHDIGFQVSAAFLLEVHPFIISARIAFAIYIQIILWSRVLE
jgi:hypothetical protein